MKKILAIFLIMSASLCASAQDIDVHLGIRTNFQGARTDGDWVSDQCGFMGDRYCLYINGSIDENFSYSIRHKLNQGITIQNMFQATDWIQLQYSGDNGWYFIGGKVPSEYGSWEYDKDPINMYFFGESVGNYNCFLMGASAGKTFNEGRDAIVAQATKSPYCTEEANGLYAYNLCWHGSHGKFSTLYSVNAMQLDKRTFEYHLALGNRLVLNGTVLELDLIDRMLEGYYGPFGKIAVSLNVEHPFAERFKFIGKLTADEDIWRESWTRKAGCALEFYPGRSREARTFVYLQHTFDLQRVPDFRILQYYTDRTAFGLGVAWNIHLIRR